MKRATPWVPPAWTDAPAAKFRMIHELQGCGVQVHVTTPDREHRGGFALDLWVDPAGTGRRRIRILFSRGAAVPDVYVDGPRESPHRYADGALCMWFPRDPPQHRWTRTDGARQLLGLIIAHLIREAWWRRTGEWPGDEAPHVPAPKPVDPAAGSETAAIHRAVA